MTNSGKRNNDVKNGAEIVFWFVAALIGIIILIIKEFVSIGKDIHRLCKKIDVSSVEINQGLCYN